MTREWNGDEWRWYMLAATHRETISVIEPPEKTEQPKDAVKIPFGFARAVPVEREPLTWDGDDG